MPPSPFLSRADSGRIRIASNPWTENASLNTLMLRWGLLKDYGIDAVLVPAQGIAGPFEAICAGEADLCMVSGYNRVLPRISAGAPVRIVGAGMRKAALTVLSRVDSIRSLADLEGRSVAIGPRHGLLHVLLLQAFRERALDARSVRFVNAGSNDQCHRAVAEGTVEACCTSISHLEDDDGLHPVHGGHLWQALPRYTFQTAYASQDAIRDKHDALVAVMAAHGALYGRLMTPESREDYFAARASVEGKSNSAAARATWNFLQTERPYCRDLTLHATEIDYLQSVFCRFGLMERTLPASRLADMAPAQAAARLLE